MVTGWRIAVDPSQKHKKKMVFKPRRIIRKSHTPSSHAPSTSSSTHPSRDPSRDPSFRSTQLFDHPNLPASNPSAPAPIPSQAASSSAIVSAINEAMHHNRPRIARARVASSHTTSLQMPDMSIIDRARGQHS